MLWLWSLDNADRDGRLLFTTIEDIEEAAYWDGEPGELYRALVACRWVDEVKDDIYIHDWDEFNKPFYQYVDRKDKDKLRKRQNDSAVNSMEIPPEFRDSPSPSPSPSSKDINNPPIVPPGGNANKSGESLLVKKATGEPKKVSHSKTRKREKTELTEEQKNAFATFWDIWPKKVSKGQAEETWRKLDPKNELLEAILKGVENAKKYDHRFLPGGFMPHASTWLNAKGWLDEHKPAQPQPPNNPGPRSGKRVSPVGNRDVETLYGLEPSVTPGGECNR